ncbi:hypothetical protein D3C80_1082980 [compost metagenome]
MGGEIGRLQLAFNGGGGELRLDVGVAVAQFGVGPAAEGRLGWLGAGVGAGQHDDLAGQLAAPLVEVLDLGDRGDDDAGADGSVGRGRPGHRNGAQLDRTRRGHAGAGANDRPAAAELEAFGADVGQTPVAEALLAPLLGLTHLRRIGHPSADPVGQIGGGLHDLAVVQALVDDAVDGDAIDRLRQSRRGDAQGRQPDEQMFHVKTPSNVFGTYDAMRRRAANSNASRRAGWRWPPRRRRCAGFRRPGQP